MAHGQVWIQQPVHEKRRSSNSSKAKVNPASGERGAACVILNPILLSQRAGQQRQRVSAATNMLQQYDSEHDSDDAPVGPGSGGAAAASGGAAAAAVGTAAAEGTAGSSAGDAASEGDFLLTPVQQKVATICRSQERVMWAMSPTGSIGMSPGGTVYAEEDLEPLQKGKSLFQS